MRLLAPLQRFMRLVAPALAGWQALGQRVQAARERLFPPRPLGQLGERAAERHLRRLGYKIVARGQRAEIGELDLVAVDGRTVVFVEVKTRRSHEGGHPAEAVDAAKQRRLTRLAVSFLRRHGLLDYPSRFDVVAVTWPPTARRPEIEHIKNAFEAQGRQGMYS